MFGGRLILGEGDAALRLNFGHAEGAVGAGAGKDHADGAIALSFGEGTHEMVDGHVQAPGLLAGTQLQGVIGDGHGGIGRNDVDVIGLNGHAVGHFFDGHGGFLGDQLSEQAVMLGVEMLNEDVGQAGVRRQIGDEFAEGFDAARGGADGNDQ